MQQAVTTKAAAVPEQNLGGRALHDQGKLLGQPPQRTFDT